MIVLRPTSHVASDDLSRIPAAVDDAQPDVVALELDERRLQALLTDTQQRPHDPFLLVLNTLQRLVGRHTGVMPGADMQAAFEAAADRGIDVALIDRDIAVTVQRLRDAPLREKLKMVAYLVAGPLVGGGPGSAPATVPDPDLVDAALTRFRIGFPRLHDALITERNDLMADRLRHLDTAHGTVLAFVGAGHVPGLQDRLPDATVAP